MITRLKKIKKKDIRFGVKVSRPRKLLKERAYITSKIIEFCRLRKKPFLISSDQSLELRSIRHLFDKDKCIFKICGKYVYKVSMDSIALDLLRLSKGKFNQIDMIVIADNIRRAYKTKGDVYLVINI